jgi:hypothetical protein
MSPPPCHWVLELIGPTGQLVHKTTGLTKLQVREAFYRAIGGDVTTKHLPKSLEFRVRWEEQKQEQPEERS